jgi:hypothetical protein
MAGQRITEEEVCLATKKVKKAGHTPKTIGRCKLARLLGVTEGRANALLKVMRGQSGTSKELSGDMEPDIGEPTDAAILEAIRAARGGATLRSLSEKLDRSERTVESSIRRLAEQNYNLVVRPDTGEHQLTPDVEPGGQVIVHVPESFTHKWRAFGALGDTHLGSKHERLDVVNALYDRYVEEGITEVYHAGNWIEGECRFNRHDIKVFGLDAQIDYFIQNYPQRKGITTHYVAGDDHEGWYQQREQIVIGAHLEDRATAAGRKDLKYLGYLEGDVRFRVKGGEDWMRVMHPGGGATYAFSYVAQKQAEAYQGGEKPRIVILGHYHKYDSCYPREVWVLQVGCCVDQSIFMRKKPIAAHVGGCICWIHQAPGGVINRFRHEFLPFYDRDFYAKRRTF